LGEACPVFSTGTDEGEKAITVNPVLNRLIMGLTLNPLNPLNPSPVPELNSGQALSQERGTCLNSFRIINI